MTANALAGRKLPSWIDGFISLTASSPAPEIFRKWAAISTLAGVMQRKLWSRVYDMDLFPNLYVFLVGPPGVGKTVSIIVTRKLWKKVKELHVSPTSMTGASLADALNEAKCRIVQPARVPPYVEYNSLLIASPELSVLLPGYDGEMMNKLTDLFDCGVFEETRRTMKIKIVIPDTQLNIIAGTTPSYLNDLLPVGAWDQGFISRVIMVYSGLVTTNELFAEVADSSEAFKALAWDLESISTLFGKMIWTPEAKRAIEAWHKAKGPPVPGHPRLIHYVTRRSTHLIKLCMIASVSRGADLTISLEDYQTALGWLVEAEFYMPDIFKAMVTGGDASAIEEAFYYVFQTYTREKMEPVAEHRLVQFLMARVPNHSVMRVIELMVRSNMIEITGANKMGSLYKPVARQMHVS